jgi:hypothetical protein
LYVLNHKNYLSKISLEGKFRSVPCRAHCGDQPEEHQQKVAGKTDENRTKEKKK